jgi:hypothetical protein
MRPGDEARLAKARRDREDAEKALSEANAVLQQRRGLGLTDAHPDMIQAKNGVAVAQAAMQAASRALADTEADVRMRSTTFDPSAGDTGSMEREMARIDTEIAQINAKKGVVDAGVLPTIATPVDLQTTFERLFRAYNSNKIEHEDIQIRLDKAKLELARALGKTGDAMAILDPAFAPSQPFSGGRTKTRAAGLALAALLAFLYAYARVVFNDTVIDSEDIEALRIIPVLGALPKLTAQPNPPAAQTTALAKVGAR